MSPSCCQNRLFRALESTSSFGIFAEASCQCSILFPSSLSFSFPSSSSSPAPLFRLLSFKLLLLLYNLYIYILKGPTNTRTAMTPYLNFAHILKLGVANSCSIQLNTHTKKAFSLFHNTHQLHIMVKTTRESAVPWLSSSVQV